MNTITGVSHGPIRPNAGAKGGGPGASGAHKAALGLQAVFVGEMLKAMRATVPEQGIASGGDAETTMQTLYDQHLASVISERMGGALVQSIERELLQSMRRPPTSPDPSASLRASSPRVVAP